MKGHGVDSIGNQTSKSFCKHCNTDVFTSHIQNKNGDQFCCYGCLYAFELLHQEDLDFYYEMISQENKKPPRVNKNDSYIKWLEKQKFEIYGSQEKKEEFFLFKCNQIECSACAYLIENILIKNKIERFSLDIITGTLQLKYSKLEDLKGSLRILYSLGYEFWLLDEKEEFRQNVFEKNQLKKVIVAAFGLGNVMLFSFSSYFGIFVGIEVEFELFFGWLSCLISFFVCLYSGSDLFKRSWQSIANRAFSFDIPLVGAILLAFSLSIYHLWCQIPVVYFDSICGILLFVLGARYFMSSRLRRDSLDWIWIWKFAKQKVELFDSADFVGVASLKKGQKYILGAGEYVPVDSILVSDNCIACGSFISGESFSKCYDRDDSLSSGMAIESENTVLECLRPFSLSYASKLIEKIPKSLKKDLYTSQDENKISTIFSICLLITGVILFGFRSYYDSVESALISVISLFIIACPCALALSKPLSIGFILSALKKLGVHLSHDRVLNKVNEIEAVVFDKTGTITLVQSEVENWFWINHKDSTNQQILGILKGICLYNAHPVSRAISEALDVKPLDPKGEYTEYGGYGVELQSSDGLYRLGKLDWLSDNGVVVKNKSEYQQYSTGFSLNQKLICLLSFKDEIKPSCFKMLKSLQSNNKRIYMLTGDSLQRTRYFKSLSLFDDIQCNMSPFDKEFYVQCLEKKYKTLFVGDGVNDYLAMQASYLSAGFATKYVDVATKTDVYLSHNNFEGLFQAFVFSKQMKKGIFINYSFSIFYNLVSIFFIFKGMISPLLAAILMPLSSLFVFGFSFFYFRKIRNSFN